jgi:hypothetical protein
MNCEGEIKMMVDPRAATIVLEFAMLHLARFAASEPLA